MKSGYLRYMRFWSRWGSFNDRDNGPACFTQASEASRTAASGAGAALDAAGSTVVPFTSAVRTPAGEGPAARASSGECWPAAIASA